MSNEKLVSIVGGTSGMGRATALKLAGEGFRVVIAGRDAVKIAKVVAESEGKVDGLTCEISDGDSVKHFCSIVHEKFGVPDVLVITAGIQSARRTLDDLSTDEFTKLLATNVTGFFNIFKEFVPIMRKRTGAHIVVVSSIAGSEPSSAGGIAYAACKHAVAGMMKTIRLEKANRGLRFSVISPGPTDTTFLRYRSSPVPDEVRAKMLTTEQAADAICLAARMEYPGYLDDLKLIPADF